MQPTPLPHAVWPSLPHAPQPPAAHMRLLPQVPLTATHWPKPPLRELSQQPPLLQTLFAQQGWPAAPHA